MDRRASFVTLLVWVALAPLLWGSVAEVGTPGQGWFPGFRDAGGPYALFRVLAYLSLALLIPSLLGRYRGASGTRAGAQMILFLLALIALAAFQLIPLPTGIYGILAPGHAADLEVLLPERGWSPISTDPGYTGRALVHLFVLLCASVVVYHTIRTPRRAWILLGTIMGAAAVGAAYGIGETHFLDNAVLGVPKQDVAGGVSGTFFYPSNFAAYAAAALGLAGAGLVQSFRRGRAWRAAGMAVALVVLAAALLLSRSRAGLGAGGLALAVGIALSLRNRRVAFVSFGLVLVAVVGAGLTISSLRERFELFSGDSAGRPIDMRTSAWAATLELAAGRPVLGTGLGSYRRAIHLTQHDDTPEELYFAHSDPLNLLAEGGAVGLLLGLVLVITGSIIAFRLSRDREHPGHGVGVACFAAIVGFVLMSLVDFPMQIPATSLAFICLIFIPVAVKAGPTESRPAGTARLWLARLASLAGLSLLMLGVGEDLGQTHEEPGILTHGEMVALEGRRLGSAGEVERAAAQFRVARDLQPFEAGTRFRLASALYRDPETWDEARQEVRAAYRLSRGRAELLFRIGHLSLGDRKLADLTEDAFREAAALNPHYFPKIIGLPEVPTESLRVIVPEDPALLDLLGRYFTHLNRHEEALEAYQKAVDLGGKGQVEKRLEEARRRVENE